MKKYIWMSSAAVVIGALRVNSVQFEQSIFWLLNSEYYIAWAQCFLKFCRCKFCRLPVWYLTLLHSERPKLQLWLWCQRPHLRKDDLVKCFIGRRLATLPLKVFAIYYVHSHHDHHPHQYLNSCSHHIWQLFHWKIALCWVLWLIDLPC